MEQIQMAKLTLKTSTMAPNTFSQYGTVDQYRTNITWNNINMRLLLGDMYDRYDLFNLQLVNIGCDDDITYDVDGVTVLTKVKTCGLIPLIYTSQPLSVRCLGFIIILVVSVVLLIVISSEGFRKRRFRLYD